MAALSSFLRGPLPATRRAYSIFSKPGGGRYFNSAKPPSSATNSSKSKVESSATSSNGEITSSAPVVEEANPQPPTSMNTEAKPVNAPPLLGVNFTPYPIHPPVNPHDLKLHQFFSLHRPLLTISQPVSSIFESSPTSLTWPPAVPTASAHFGTMDDPPEASPESDADAARQLARAMVTNRVGAALTWEATLKRLGLDIAAERAEEVSQAEAEFEMYMDSTKRKRRRKMKKHKLKKRRRLSRQARIKTR